MYTPARSRGKTKRSKHQPTGKLDWSLFLICIFLPQNCLSFCLNCLLFPQIVLSNCKECGFQHQIAWASITTVSHISFMLLLLLLSRFSHIRLCATPYTAAHQASPSLGFSRQEHWSELRFLFQCKKVKSESEVTQSCPILYNPMDCSLPGSSVHGIFQARILEWGTIAFSVSYMTLSKFLSIL